MKWPLTHRHLHLMLPERVGGSELAAGSCKDDALLHVTGCGQFRQRHPALCVGPGGETQPVVCESWCKSISSMSSRSFLSQLTGPADLYPEQGPPSPRTHAPGILLPNARHAPNASLPDTTHPGEGPPTSSDASSSGGTGCGALWLGGSPCSGRMTRCPSESQRGAFGTLPWRSAGVLPQRTRRMPLGGGSVCRAGQGPRPVFWGGAATY